MPLMHATEDALELYVLERLDRKDRDEIDTHLLVCDECRDILTRLDGEIADLRIALNDWDLHHRTNAAEGKRKNGNLLIFKPRPESTH
jgi:anti-sigma factor RsiW